MKPQPAKKEDVLAVLDDMRARVEADDSFEGFLEYTVPPRDDELLKDAEFALRASYRIGNSEGQGGVRMIGSTDELESVVSLVKGQCPMGCGTVLAIDGLGRVVCTDPDCPDREAVHKILGIEETEHVVTFTEENYTVEHPLRERIPGPDHMTNCQLHHDIGGLGGPPEPPGRYRATRHEPDRYSESYRGDAIPWDFDRIEPSP